MSTVPTVRVVHPTAPDGFVIINASDLTADHVLWDDAPPVAAGLRIGRGARGKWYVWHGPERVAGPFNTEAEAALAMSPENGG